MDQRNLRIVEYDKIIAMLRERCVSPMGEEVAAALHPSRERLYIERWQRETTEASDFLYKTAHSPVRPFDDIRPALEKARIGSMLQMGELLQVALCLSVSRAMRSQMQESAKENGLLIAYAGQLSSLKHLEDDIRGCILSPDEMSDHASPELARIRRDIRQCHARVSEKLNQMIRSPQYAKYLQDPIVTVRNGRYVVPVRQEFRGQVPGLIHDQSGSGATLFVEPMAVVEINNQLMELEGMEREEIERILLRLTAQVGEAHGDILHTVETMAQLDFIFAKGKLSHDMRASEPVLQRDFTMHIKQGRHPLIPRDVVVPITLWLGKDFTTLVITGPNTGGKTVTLKTCGLFALMTQAGLHIPASENSQMPIFDEVFADIGDEQSIEQSLSTFSSHMTNIVSILGRVTPRSLVLLDELGAGTDPTEGAALAIAIMEKLQSIRACTLATTHYSEIKAYALSSPGVENASVEFDVATLSPTYRLSIGIPGKSNAFEISRRLGLSDGIIQKASEYLSQEQIRFEDVIKNAEYHRQMAEKERKVAEEARLEMEQLRKEADKQRTVLEGQRDEILRKAQDQARSVIERAKQDAEAVIRDIKGLKASAQSAAVVDRHLQEARDKVRTLDKRLHYKKPTSQEPSSPPPKDLKTGDYVRLLDIDQIGTVLAPPNERGDVLVQLGIMKLTTQLENLRREKAKEGRKAEIKPRETHFRALEKMTPTQLDVHGYNAEEGMLEVDRYLDEAFMSNLSEVTIIHGKGTGILRDAIHRLLRHHKHVDSFRSGKYGEGEGGVTIVKLK